MYYLLLLEAVTSVYVRSVCVCFLEPVADVCKNDVAMQIGNGIVFVGFFMVIVWIRNYAYYPFQNVKHSFSMYILFLM